MKLGGAAALGAGLPATLRADVPPAVAAPRSAIPSGSADYAIRIGTGLVELGQETTISTKLYNSQFPGPLLRLTEGRRATIDVHNDTDTQEQLHWHGQFLPPEVDGASEEGTPFIPARGRRRFSITPGPAGFRFYHTHLVAGADLSAGLYSGQVGLVYIEPRREPGAYDREVFLTLKEFGPVLSRTEMALDFLAPTGEVEALRKVGQASLAASIANGLPQGYEVAYTYFSINGRMLGSGDPIRVKSGERVLFHILNASATAIRSLSLPGHLFHVVALDGNPVPTPADVPVLWIGGAERVSAIVEMNQPGKWVMGDLMDEDRARGMGVIVEYAGATGEPQWVAPASFRWDYRKFGRSQADVPSPDAVIEMVIAANNAARHGFDEFTINGIAFSMERMEPMFRVSLGKRYRLRLRNATDDIHPMHLHRHSFELTRIAGQPTAGILKDVVMLGSYQEMEIDFTADQPGISLFHCHMQSHMDFGLMALFHSS